MIGGDVHAIVPVSGYTKAFYPSGIRSLHIIVRSAFTASYNALRTERL